MVDFTLCLSCFSKIWQVKLVLRKEKERENSFILLFLFVRIRYTCQKPSPGGREGGMKVEKSRRGRERVRARDWCGKDILLRKTGLVLGGSNASGWIPYNARNFKIFHIHLDSQCFPSLAIS